jgi:uncharacterized protein (TIGR03435 family)
MLRIFVSACMLLNASAWAQTFEAASIKPSQSASPDRQITGVQTPGRGWLNTFSTSLRMLIIYAYNVKDFQLSGGPGWANSEAYDIVAKGGSKIQEDTTSARSRLGLTEPGKFAAQKASPRDVRSVAWNTVGTARGG